MFQPPKNPWVAVGTVPARIVIWRKTLQPVGGKNVIHSVLQIFTGVFELLFLFAIGINANDDIVVNSFFFAVSAPAIAHGSLTFNERHVVFLPFSVNTLFRQWRWFIKNEKQGNEQQK